MTRNRRENERVDGGEEKHWNMKKGVGRRRIEEKKREGDK